ncbi:MAG: DNA polymerase III subunit chi [Rubrivivax sp.]
MPAQVEFHTGVAAPALFTCRLLRKAVGAGARVLVTAAPADLAALDELLWTFDPQAFVPHVRIPGPADALAARTPVWLCSEPPARPWPPVLVNLGAAPPAAADDFERVIEVVGTEPEARVAARQRWRHYEGWGVVPLHHTPRG